MTSYADAHQFAQRTATLLLAPFAIVNAHTGDPSVPFDVYSARYAVAEFPEDVITIVAPAT